jgi:hypothetical protein
MLVPVVEMIYPAPRADRWDLWIAWMTLAGVTAALGLVRLLAA